MIISSTCCTTEPEEPETEQNKATCGGQNGIWVRKTDINLITLCSKHWPGASTKQLDQSLWCACACLHACVRVIDSIRHPHITQDLRKLTRHRAPLTPWPYKAGACSPLWPADAKSFDLPLCGDDRQAEARRAAAVNIELIEQMLFLSKCVGIKWANPPCSYQMW